MNVHELIAWDLDEYSYRRAAVDIAGEEEFAKRIVSAQLRLAKRELYANCSALLLEETERIRPLLRECAERPDLQQEYEGLDWALGVVDLGLLLAFQRRLVFGPVQHTLSIQQDDWPELIALTLGPQRDTRYHLVCNNHTSNNLDISLHSANPDLQLRLLPNAGANGYSPLSLYGGSPFFEAAELRGRWFLRDGYHRAYRLLQAGVDRVPAVVIKARTLEELGATDTWFFSEDTLFSDRPPRIADFLEEDLVLRYDRIPLRKVIRVRIEESLQPFDSIEKIQGDEL